MVTPEVLAGMAVRLGLLAGCALTWVASVFSAFVAAGAVINRNVKPYALMAGVPAKQIGWMSQHGERLDLPLGGQGTATCVATGNMYQLSGDALTFLEVSACK